MKRWLLALGLVLLLAAEVQAYKFASGTYTGTGSGFTVDISDTSTGPVADFQPDACIVKGDSATDAVMRISGMDATESSQADGSGIITDGITVLAANGFTIGTGATVNTNTVVYYYACWATDASNDFAFGTYAGNVTDGTDIVISPAFQPEMVMIVPDASVPIAWRGANSHSGDSTSVLSASGNATNQIQAFNADGFELGSSASVNNTGVNYYYIAFKSGVSTIDTGSYTANTGTCADDCAVTGVGFQPQFTIVKVNGATAAAIKFAPQTEADDSCASNGSSFGCAANAIQSFDADGFTYGGDARVNTNATLHHHFSIRTAAVTSTGATRRRGN